MGDEKTATSEAKTGAVQFLREVSAEIKKVSWSTRKELVTYTGVVGIAVIIVCALIWVCDTFFARLFHLILR